MPRRGGARLSAAAPPGTMDVVVRLHPLLAALALAVPTAPLGDAPSAPDGPGGAEGRVVAEPVAKPRPDEAERAGLTGAPVPTEASGRLRTVPLTVPALALPPREQAPELRTVRVEVEDGVPVDPVTFAERVMEILQDPRGWGHDGSARFVRTDAEADLTVVLASPALTDRLCAPLRTMGAVSCANEGRAVLNAVRWAEGAAPFLDAGGTLPQYHEYLVNHEVGHLLGHGHTGCPRPGGPAPVMLQQTLGLEGCTPNAWPSADPQP